MAKGTLSKVKTQMINYKKKNPCNLYQKQKVIVFLYRASKKKKTVK